MDSLPPEILFWVAEELEQASRLTFRASNRRLCAIVTPSAFRRLHVLHSVQGTTALLHLLQQECIASCVQEIETLGFIPTTESDTIKVQENLVEACTLLHTLPLLHTLSFVFSDLRAEPFSLRIQTAILSALESSNPQSLRVVSFWGLVSYGHSVLSRPALLNVFHGLTKLAISTTTVLSRLDVPDSFWTRELPSLLYACAGTLRSLSICDDSAYVLMGLPQPIPQPIIPLHNFYFPNLTHLRLMCFSLDALPSVEAFIARHTSTLASLTIVGRQSRFSSLDQYHRTWTDVHRRIKDGLPQSCHYNTSRYDA